jgi:DNA polymerase elongation subunit (family B)
MESNGVVTETSFETAVSNEAAKKNRNLKWEKLPKYTQWKLFKTYMHENKITEGDLFKRMKSMISEKRTDVFVTYDIATQQVTNVDFKHEVFIRERSKKKKLQVQLAQASEEQKVKELEAEINGLSLLPDTVEVVEEEEVHIE